MINLCAQQSVLWKGEVTIGDHIDFHRPCGLGRERVFQVELLWPHYPVPSRIAAKALQHTPSTSFWRMLSAEIKVFVMWHWLPLPISCLPSSYDKTKLKSPVLRPQAEIKRDGIWVGLKSLLNDAASPSSPRDADLWQKWETKLDFQNCPEVKLQGFTI